MVVKELDGRETPSAERDPAAPEAAVGVLPLGLLRSPGGIAALQRSIGNAATCRLLRAEDDSFDDDPLAAGDPDGSIRVKPGPMRTTLIRTTPVRSKDGFTFRRTAPDDPGAWSQAFLSWAAFDWVLSPTADPAKPTFKYVLRSLDDKLYGLPELVQLVVDQGAIAGMTLDPAQVEAVAASLARPIVPSAGKQDDSRYLLITWMFVPKQISTKLRGGSGQTASNPLQQVAGAYTFKFHKDGSAGFEYSIVVQGQFTKDPDTGKFVEQPMAGGQGALVSDFFTPLVQVQAIGQVLAGATITGGDAIEGAFTCWRHMTIQPTVQAAAGAQAVFTVPGTDKHLQIFLQGQVGLTSTGGMVTLDRSTGIGIGWAF
jgi:hypothetical protein